MAAVQEAALELLAERGPREVTIRDVAERAGVNHALVHRHFGTKDDLIRAVVVLQSQELGMAAAAVAEPDVAAMLELLRAHPAYWRVLARAVLDAPELLAEAKMPAAGMVLGIMSGGADADADTKIAAAVAGSLALGWLVFGPHLLAVLEVEDAAGFDKAVADAVRALTDAERR
ncbi:MAG: TetR/AcrR family transcriptional regulator, repressor for neighboring sulfatase [Pseudonocardiales bacterium]|nr:TetR/AcrR family transcriptional regulator, repressor for neighboring sulfatase [Pseudonocardiales bacterium]